MTQNKFEKASQWQRDIWDNMSAIYADEVDTRFRPIVQHLISLCSPESKDTILDHGCGTGAVSAAVASEFGSPGRITAVDISPKMLNCARENLTALGYTAIKCLEGRAERLPVADSSQDLILSSLCFMFVLDKRQAVNEVVRALKSDGIFIAALWGGRENTDIVKFQEIAGSFGPTPPAQGAGPGSLADPAEFITDLESHGLDVSSESIVTSFEVESLEHTWNTLASVTAQNIEPRQRELANNEIMAQMWPDGDGPREFRNKTQFIIAKN